MGGSQHFAYSVGVLSGLDSSSVFAECVRAPAVGGAAGFYRAQSKASLVAGLSVGALMVYSGYLIGQDDFKVMPAPKC